jgi:hypothetical protein
VRGPRRRKGADRTLRWTDADGNVYEDTREPFGTVPAVAQVKRSDRLATITCEAGHVFALVERPVAGRPAVIRVQAPASIGFGIFALVVDGRLGYAMTDVEQGTVGVLGTPRSSILITCPRCQGDYVLDAADIPADPTAHTVEVRACRATE